MYLIYLGFYVKQRCCAHGVVLFDLLLFCAERLELDEREVEIGKQLLADHLCPRMHIGAGLVAEHAVAAVPEDAESRKAPNDDIEGGVVVADGRLAGDERQDGRGGDQKVQRDEEHPCRCTEAGRG